MHWSPTFSSFQVQVQRGKKVKVRALHRGQLEKEVLRKKKKKGGGYKRGEGGGNREHGQPTYSGGLLQGAIPAVYSVDQWGQPRQTFSKDYL